MGIFHLPLLWWTYSRARESGLVYSDEVWVVVCIRACILDSSRQLITSSKVANSCHRLTLKGGTHDSAKTFRVTIPQDGNMPFSIKKISQKAFLVHVRRASTSGHNMAIIKDTLFATHTHIASFPGPLSPRTIFVYDLCLGSKGHTQNCARRERAWERG